MLPPDPTGVPIITRIRIDAAVAIRVIDDGDAVSDCGIGRTDTELTRRIITVVAVLENDGSVFAAILSDPTGVDCVVSEALDVGVSDIDVAGVRRPKVDATEFGRILVVAFLAVGPDVLDQAVAADGVETWN